MFYIFGVCWLRFALLLAIAFVAARLSAQSLPGPLLQVAMQGNNAVVTWPTNSSGYYLQYADDLSSTNWTIFQDVTSDGDNYIATDLAGGNSRYYRLIFLGDISQAPTLGPVPLLNITSTRYVLLDGIPLTDVTSGTNKFNTIQPHTLDASAFIDPAGYQPGSLPLQYSWLLSYVDSSGSIPALTDAGITGTTSSVLQFIPESVPSGGTLTVNLSVISSNTELRTRMQIVLTTTGKGNIVTISYYNTCQQSTCAPTDPTCACQVWAALPVGTPFPPP